MNKIKLTKALMNGHKMYKDLDLFFIGNGDFMLSTDIASEDSNISHRVYTKEILATIQKQDLLTFDVGAIKVTDKRAIFEVGRKTKDQNYIQISSIQKLYYDKILKPIATKTSLSIFATYGEYNCIVIKHQDRIVGLILLCDVKL